MEPMDDADIEEALAEVPDWERDGDHIARSFDTDGFQAALDLVQRIGEVAEDQFHHPDICIRDYDRVDVRVTTHDAGGLTSRDFELARALDQLED